MGTYEEDDKLRRDMAIARKHRDKPRYSKDLGDVAKQWLRGPEANRLRKFQKINTVMEDYFDKQIFECIRAQSFNNGTLTLIIADSVLLSEIKNHHHHHLHEALIHAGTGVSKIVYRLKK